MFKCKPYIKGNEDLAWWVPIQEFKKHFDQSDFHHNRKVLNVEDAYSEDWFCVGSNNEKLFELPTVCEIEGKTQFINGRHRVAVLIQHLDILPIVFTPSALELLGSLNLEQIKISEGIMLPELPVLKFRCDTAY
jgi:hypothetical protein